MSMPSLEEETRKLSVKRECEKPGLRMHEERDSGAATSLNIQGNSCGRPKMPRKARDDLR